MDIRQLRYFAAAAEEGHIGRAAVRLNLSQPALSRQIQLLEAKLGVKLLERTSRGVSPTQAGAVLLDDSLSIQNMVQRAAERAQNAGLGKVGTLDVGAFGSVLYAYLPRLLSAFAVSNSKVKVVLHHAAMEHLVLALRQKRILVAFERRVLNEPDIDCRVVAHERAFVALPSAHPIAEQASVQILDLRKEPLILGRDVGRSRGSVEFCREHGFEPLVAAVAADMTVAAVMVASGTGSCIVPESLLNLRLPGIVFRPLFGKRELTYDIYCYSLTGEQAPLAKSLLACAHERAKTTMGNGPTSSRSKKTAPWA